MKKFNSIMMVLIILLAIMLIKVLLRMNWKQSKFIIMRIAATAVAMILLNFIAVV